MPRPTNKKKPTNKRRPRAIAQALSVDVTPTLTEDERVARAVALAGSVLKFRNVASEALNGLLVKMIEQNEPIYGSAFSTPTPQARPCVLVLAVGEEDCAMLTQAIHLCNKNREQGTEEAHAT
jgi:hypothetical protein